MKMTENFAAGLVAVATFCAVLFTSTNADSMNPAQSPAVAPPSSVQPAHAVAPLNAKETPEDQLGDHVEPVGRSAR